MEKGERYWRGGDSLPPNQSSLVGRGRAWTQVRGLAPASPLSAALSPLSLALSPCPSMSLSASVPTSVLIWASEALGLS